jgi:hypothetical protein
LARLCGGELLHSLHPARCGHNDNLLTAGRPKHIILLAFPGVPNWPILRPHNSKGGPSENVSDRANLWQNFGHIFPEMAEKGPNI